HTVRPAEPELIARVVDHLSRGRLVAWWTGRGEIGQRALGARSILCDPRHRNAGHRLNSVQGREIGRPRAPSVLAEHEADGCGTPPGALSEFMLAAIPVRRQAQRMLAASVHVDGTARPQVVRRSVNRRFWTLIEGFRRATGVPALVNTSFNLAG